MCGIVALINSRNLSIDIDSLLDRMRHRGPDDRGWAEWRDDSSELGKERRQLSGNVILGHVRLSIIDLSSAGWQPMQSSCGRYSLIFNGELYNYRELRNELEALGHEFRSQTDSEVLLNAIIEWNTDALSRFRGMFAFVFYDSRSRKMFACRDFFGIKPLYWCRWEGGLALASEADVLLELPGVTSESDPQATYDYLVFGATEHQQQSIYRDLYHFPAAHFAEIDIDDALGIEPRRYWSIDLNNRISPEFDEAVTEVRRLFLESIDLHLRSDVPVGTALSGGIDSSAIVCAIRHLYPDQEIHTISYIAEDVGINEERWIDIVNRHAGCIAHKVQASQGELVSDLDDLIRAQGEPFGSTSIYAQYRIFHEARKQGLKVMLDGQGADEILAGYIGYQGSRLASLVTRARWIRAWQFLNRCGRWPGRSKIKILMLAANEILPEWLRWWARSLASRTVPPKWIAAHWRRSAGIDPKPDLARGITGRDILRGRLLETLTCSSIPRLLRYEDRNSMHFSIESRVPFLHVDLVEYLFALPEEYLLSADATTKCVFREAMRGIVPDEILDRHDKIGFATPEKSWLLRLDAWVKDIFRYGQSVPCFDMAEVEREWRAIIGGRKEFSFKCWRWLNLIAWEKAK